MALNRAEIMRHIGEMIDHGSDALVAVSPDHRHWITKITRFAKDYVQNGSYTTQSERAEAMLTIKRKLFAKVTGLDPDTSSHYFNNHWLPDRETDSE